MKLNKEAITAVTALIVAIAGLVTILMDAGEEKAELTYELLKQRIDYIEKHLETQYSDSNELRNMVRSLLIQRAQEASRAVGTKHRRASKPSGFAEDIIDNKLTESDKAAEVPIHKMFKAHPKLSNDLDLLLEQRSD